MLCRLCGKHVTECASGMQVRVNEKGVDGIWECRPDCTTVQDQDTALIKAIEGDENDRRNNT